MSTYYKLKPSIKYQKCDFRMIPFNNITCKIKF